MPSEGLLTSKWLLLQLVEDKKVSIRRRKKAYLLSNADLTHLADCRDKERKEQLHSLSYYPTKLYL